MERTHRYTATIEWTGNQGTGTLDYRAYSRNHKISIDGKTVIEASSDSAFRGDPSRHTPEDLLVSSLSGCHMLWYLHLCAVNGVVVLRYRDEAEAEMVENEDGSGQFSKVILHPRVVVSKSSMFEKAQTLHDEAHRMCFIARSVNFSMQHNPEVTCYEEA